MDGRQDGEARGGGPRNQVTFFRNYNRTLGAAYGMLLLGLTGFFGWQLSEAFDDELAFVRGQIERHAQFLEFVLRSSGDEIERLRLVAAAERESGRACREGRQEALHGQLRAEARSSDSPDPSASVYGGPSVQAPAAAVGFHRDLTRTPDAGGNLVGLGPLTGRSDDFYCDLGSALAIGGQLQGLSFHLPHAARVRFLAAERFELVYPWQSSDRIPFSAEVYRDPVWTQAQPQANPDRRKFWAPPFFGGPEAGLLAPVAAPVATGERFLGVVAIDMSLDYLNRVNGYFGYPLGTVAVVDDRGHVMAHPGVYADPLAVRSPAGLEQAVRPELLPTVAAVASLPSGEPVFRAGWILIQRPFVSAPWYLVYAVPQSAVWRKLVLERVPGMAAALLALVLIMAISYALTRREFVGPAARLVEYVAAASTLRATTLPKVPQAWRPWFDAVGRAFGESLQLGSLRKELDIAARLQQAILPRQWPQDTRFSLWGAMQPAKDIGGDFYDHFPLGDGRRGLVVADVSGKGVSAGLFGMVSKTQLRSLATHRLLGPATTLAEVNEALCVDNDAAMFVTAFYAQYDPVDGTLSYSNAGHPPPLLVRKDGAQTWLGRSDGPALGVVEGAHYGERSVHLAPGDMIVIFTDGVSEAMDREGREFGLPQVGNRFEQSEVSSAREAVEHLQAAVAAFSDGAEQADDITCVVLFCHGLGLDEEMA